MAYEYNCLMVAVPIPGWGNWPRIIKSDHIFEDDSDMEYGLEENPHVTILFGIHGNIGVRQITEKIKLPAIKDVDLRITGMSKFETDRYDVLKFDIDSNSLPGINSQLKKAFPYTTDYEEFIPHMTIGYLLPGHADKYIKRYNKSAAKKVRPTNYLYTTTSGRKYSFK